MLKETVDTDSVERKEVNRKNYQRMYNQIFPINSLLKQDQVL